MIWPSSCSQSRRTPEAHAVNSSAVQRPRARRSTLVPDLFRPPCFLAFAPVQLSEPVLCLTDRFASCLPVFPHPVRLCLYSGLAAPCLNWNPTTLPTNLQPSSVLTSCSEVCTHASSKFCEKFLAPRPHVPVLPLPVCLPACPAPLYILAQTLNISPCRVCNKSAFFTSLSSHLGSCFESRFNVTPLT